MRDEKWLFEKLDEVWDAYFSDVPQDNDVKIVWGRKARGRLGTIKQIPVYKLKNSSLIRNSKLEIRNSVAPGATMITINALFKDTKIPEYVVVGTIAHELAHYTHGFHSPIEQKFDKPHAGGVVHKEMDKRGLKEIRTKQNKWLKESWGAYLEENHPRKSRRPKKRAVRWGWR